MAQCKPILKWAGGKSQLLGELLSRMPKYCGKYIEPFLAAVLYILHYNPKRQ